MDPEGSHSATTAVINWEVGWTNWTFNPTLAPQASCWSWREGRKIHSGAAGLSPEPWEVTRYLLVASQLPTANSSPRDAQVGWENTGQRSFMEADMDKTFPSLVVFVFFVSFSSVFLWFSNSQRKTGLERFQPFPQCSKHKCGSVDCLHVNKQRAKATRLDLDDPNFPANCFFLCHCPLVRVRQWLQTQEIHGSCRVTAALPRVGFQDGLGGKQP